jgi:hypothetical protein
MARVNDGRIETNVEVLDAEERRRGVQINTARREFRRFHLFRSEDVSGTSGTGIVAEGVLFSTGTCVLAWTSLHRSIGVYQSLSELVAIHGHDGRTRVVWIDRP